MLVAITLTIVGLLGGITGAQLRGYRLGGVLIVPLFAIYTLRSFGTFPVLMLSVIGGYVSVWIVKRRLLLFGRQIFVISIVTSALVPLFVYVFIDLGFGPEGVVGQLGFIGSVLPGIAVYNFHRLPEERRILDAVWGMALLLFLVVVGIGLVIVVGLTALWTVTPPVLLGPESDIARAFGLTVADTPRPVVLPYPEELTMLSLGLAMSEGVRSRLGVRVGGLIVLPLLVLFVFREAWLLPLYVLTATAAYVGIQLLHRWTLIYGRVLLSMGVVFSLLVAVSVVNLMPIANGLLPFFTGILGGVGAYNIHTVAPTERYSSTLIAVGGFTLLAAIGRLLVTPLPDGLFGRVGIGHLLVGALLVGLAIREVYRLESIRPTERDRPETIGLTGEYDLEES